MRVLLFCFLMIMFNACQLADLSTTEALNKKNEEKGKFLLSKVTKAHGAHLWDKHNHYSIKVSDEFFGLVGSLGKPYPKKSTSLQIDYHPKSYDGLLQFLDGPWKGQQWGVRNFESFKIKNNKTIQNNKEKYTFWIIVYQYFLQLPDKIQEASVIRWAGRQTWKDQEYELIFASWEKAEPQKDFDQYVLWVNPQTQLIDRVDYTVRDYGKSLTGTVHYNDYREIEGIQVPFDMPVYSSMLKEGKKLHHMKLESIEFDTKEGSIFETE